MIKIRIGIFINLFIINFIASNFKFRKFFNESENMICSVSVQVLILPRHLYLCILFFETSKR